MMNNEQLRGKGSCQCCLCTYTCIGPSIEISLFGYCRVSWSSSLPMLIVARICFFGACEDGILFLSDRISPEFQASQIRRFPIASQPVFFQSRHRHSFCVCSPLALPRPSTSSATTTETKTTTTTTTLIEKDPHKKERKEKKKRKHQKQNKSTPLTSNPTKHRMVTINASTTIKVSKKKKTTGTAGKKAGGKKTGSGTAKSKRGAAPPLKPKSLASAAAIEALKQLPDKEKRVRELLEAAFGESSRRDKSVPHAASTTQDRGNAAADLAVAARELGLLFVLKKCGVTAALQLMLFPEGLQTLFHGNNSSGGLKPSASAVSLASLDNDNTTVTSANSGGTDSKRGKTAPPNCREGGLLILRALCEIVGRPAEPFVVSGFFAAALDECGSSSAAIRAAAEDTSSALVQLASPWAFSPLLLPMILQSLESGDWRVKYKALDCLSQCAHTSPLQVNYLLPKLIPKVTTEVWDTKAQVSKASTSALLAICKTCKNPDVLPAIPAVVAAISKPSETNKAVSELMSTTFVASVDAATLAILCPVLARALKERLAIHKRAACIVIKNMSRLVESPTAVAPFGPLLVPELKKVAENVQFEEIRDNALEALNNLTKALGDSYKETAETDNTDADKKEAMDKENAVVEAEQKRIEEEREAEEKREEEIRKKEEEERRKFKEAMDAQRELDKLEAEKVAKQKAKEMKAKEQAKRSTKGSSGKCQACGLKKCKPTCVFK